MSKELFGNRNYFNSTNAGSSSLTDGCHKWTGIFCQLSLMLILMVVCAASASAGVDKGTTGSATDQLGFNLMEPVDIAAAATPACFPPPAGLVGWWRLDELVGNTAQDSAGFNNQGVWINGPTPSPGKVDGALCFNGINEYVRVNSHNQINPMGTCQLDFTEPLSIDAWVKTGALGLQVIVDKRRIFPGFVRGYSLFIFNGRLGLQLAHGAGNQICGSPGSACTNFVAPPLSPFLSTNTWRFVAVTVGGCRGAVGRMYIDGNLVHTFGASPANISNIAPLLIGGGYSSGNIVTSSFKGCLDEVEILKHILTPFEIQGIFTAGSDGKCP